MPQEKGWRISEKSPASFGFSRNWRGNIKTSYFWKSRPSFVILFFVAFMVIFYTFKHASASKTPRNRKATRHLEMQAFDRDQDCKMSAQDVYIIPEKRNLHFKHGGTINRRPSYGNIGKGSGKGIHGDAMEQMHEGRSWSPKPFEATAERHPSGGEKVTTAQKAEEGRRFSSGLTRDLVSSIRLKGISMQSASKRGEHLKENFNYSKEINNLMQKGLGSETEEDGRRTSKKTYKGRGAPFKFPGGHESRREMPKPPRLTQTGRPITIFLDFYPMKEVRDRYNNKKLPQKEKLPYSEGNGMIMKLNLYPRKGVSEGLRGKVFERHTEEPLEGGNKTAARKSFGWFSKHKTKRINRPKECSIIALNPLGKEMAAKWKDRNGDWIMQSVCQ